MAQQLIDPMIQASLRLTLVAGLLATVLAAQRGPQNLDFEAGKLDRPAPGWFVPTRGYQALVAKRHGSRVGHCVHLSSTGRPQTPFGNVLQSVHARPYRGKTIRFSADVKSKGRGSRAQLWLRVDRPERQQGFFDNMGDRPITQQQWKRYQIVGKVHDDAVGITFGMMLIGRAGSAFLDNVSLEVVDDSALPKVEGPRPFAGRGLENVIAFTRLLGYVRYFHPSDQVTQVDWDRFAIEGIRKVESVKTPEELAKRLEELFGPVAPTVRVTVGEEPPLPEALRNGGRDLRDVLPDALRKRPAAKDILLVSWRHLGVNPDGGESIYKSRIVEAIPGDISVRKFGEGWQTGGRVDPMSLPSPGFPIRRTLPGGLHIMVPLSLYKDKAGTLPHATGAFPRRDDMQPRLTADDRATRLAAVALGWNVFQHFYPYFDVVDVDWSDVLPTSLQEAATDKNASEFLGTLRRIVARLQDGHGYVAHIADPDTGTLPVEFGWAGEQLVIDRVDNHRTPDVHPGDIVLKIANDPGFKARLSAEISAATPQFRRYQLARRLRQGPPGKKIELELMTPKGRKTVVLSYAAMFRPLPEKRPDKIAEIKPGVWYLDISRIDNRDLRLALADLQKAKGIVFDFRGYPGKLNSQFFFRHIVRETVESAEWLIPTPRYPDRDRMKFKDSRRWSIRPWKPYLSAKKVFLIDGRAISYAESCMGIVEHYKLGEIVGEATAGTNGNVNPITLPGGYHVAWTGMKVLKQDGSRHHGVGIQPTVKLQRTVAGIRAGKDEFLEKAVEILSRSR